MTQLLLDGGADANKAKNDFNTTPLCIAARKGHREVIRVFWVVATTDYSYRPLYAAGENVHGELIRVLLA